MNVKALLASVLIGAGLLFGLVLLETLQGILQSVIQIVVILVIVYVVYELWSGWMKGQQV